MDQDKSKAAADSAGGKDAAQGGLWRYEVPQQDAGAGAVQSNSAHYTGGVHGGDSQEGDFLKSPPEANAMPAGAPQTSRGSATGSGAAGSPGAGGGSQDAGAGKEAMPGAGGGEPAPVGNGTKHEPVWGS